MKRIALARPLAFLLPILLLSLISCTTNKPRPSTGTASVGNGPETSPENRDPGPGPDGSAHPPSADSALASEPPFPDAIDTLDWSVPNSGHAPIEAGHTADQPPVAPIRPQVSRPDGIPLRPRPKGLPDRIHVLLSRSTAPLALYSLGNMQILGEGISKTGGGKTVTVTRLATLKGRFNIRRADGGFAIEQSGHAPLITEARRLRLISVNPFNLVDVGKSVYRGSLHLIGGAKGEIMTVNVLSVEDYLRGVLPYELGTVDRDALEALKAQAIVARTYAYKRMMRPGAGDFHVYSDVQDQVYKGVRGEYLLSDRAVWETRGMAVTHADTLAICYYFSTCGGRTATKDEVWGGAAIPYLITRPDTDETGDNYCSASKYSAWTREWSPSQLAGIVRRNLRSAGVPDAPSFSAIKGIDVAQRAACGRIRLLTIKTDKGPVQVRGDKVRWALRPSATSDKILPSAFFDVKMAGGKITATGKAFGHGVGLCQVGAIGRARQKQGFKQIIDAYYTGVRIVEFR